MLPLIPKPAITSRQKAAALAVAVVVDFVQLGGWEFFGWGFLSPLEDGLDVLTAVVLMAICGFKWQFVVAFFVELLPVADIFPTWTALVLTLPTAGAARESRRVEAVEAGARVQVEQVYGPGKGVGVGRTRVVDVEAVAVPPVQERR